MTQTLEGTGTLRKHSPSAQWTVKYRFQITTRIVTKAGFPPAMGKSHSSGTVEAANGETIPLGEYQLEASDGEILRVTNLGITWAILAPL